MYDPNSLGVCNIVLEHFLQTGLKVMSQADFSSEVAKFRFLNSFPANNYSFKDNNGNIWKRCEYVQS